MVTYNVYDIAYDTDGQDVSLPETLLIQIPDGTPEDEVLEILSDKISEQTGFCHDGFLFQVHNPLAE